MLASVAPLVLLAARVAAQSSLFSSSSSTTLCVAGQCLSGSSNISIGAVVSAFGNDPLVLLPGTYSSSSDPQALRSALTSAASRLSLLPGFGNASSSSGAISFPLDIALQPGVLSTTASLYRGQTVFTPAPSSNQTSLPSGGSLVVSNNVWAAVESGGQQIVLWDSVPDVSQLPQGFGSTPLTLVNLQSTACSPACSGAGICTPAGTCECPSDSGFTGDKCEQCAPGFFGPSCSKCPDNCAKCDEGVTGSGKCLVPAVTDAPASCNCLNGQCGSNGQCSCNPGWTTASNGTSCAACAQGFFLDPTGNCQVCQNGCTACQNGNGVCTSCASGLTVDANDNTKCIITQQPGGKVCPDGTFTSGDSCAVCSPLCKTCTGAGSGACVVCAQGTYKLDGACVPVDSEGVCSGSARVANNIKNVCDACPTGCSACGIPGFNVASTFDQIQCTKCLPGSYLSNGKCVEACPSGTLVSPTDGFTCVACDSSCGTCAGDPKFCLTCSGTQLAINGTCASSCPTNTFSASGACLSCHADCASCSGAGFDQCLSCPSSRPVLQGGGSTGGRCLPTCGRSQFFQDGTCQSCDASCSSCSGAGANRCLACANPNQVLKNGVCVDAACDSGSSVVPGLGVCLSALVSAPFVDNTPPPTTTPPPVAPAPARGGRRPLAWWEILLMALGCAFICLLFVMCFRRRMRKKRAARTAAFARQMNTRHRGIFGRIYDRFHGHWNGRMNAEERSEKVRLSIEDELARMRARHAHEMAVLEARVSASDHKVPVDSWHVPSQVVVTHRFDEPTRRSGPSIYSTATGMPQPRQPLRDREVARQSGASWNSSFWNRHAQPSYEMDPVPLHHTGESFDSVSSSNSQSRNPFRR